MSGFRGSALIAIDLSKASGVITETDAVAWNEPKAIFQDDYVVLDQKKVPQNTIEQI